MEAFILIIIGFIVGCALWFVVWQDLVMNRRNPPIPHEQYLEERRRDFESELRAERARILRNTDPTYRDQVSEAFDAVAPSFDEWLADFERHRGKGHAARVPS